MKIAGLVILLVVVPVAFFAYALCRAAGDKREDDE